MVRYAAPWAFLALFSACGRTDESPRHVPAPPTAGSGGSSAAGGSESGGAASAGVANEPVAGGGSGGPPEPSDPQAVWPSAGCGRPAEQEPTVFVEFRLSTSGTKADDAQGVPGPWQLEREYFVSLPASYDPTKAYPLMVELPGCGGSGRDVYPLRPLQDRVIRIGLSPPGPSIGFPTGADPRCFDENEGDDSLDFAFYEAVLDQLNARYCYDRHRVWIVGVSSGARLGNQLACHYAGRSGGHAVRGSITALGGLETSPELGLTCLESPVAGLWLHAESGIEPFEHVASALDRARAVNGCQVSSDYDYDSADYTSFPIPGLSTSSCRLVPSCPEQYPLVFCPVPSSQSIYTELIDPAAAVLIDLLAPH